MYGENKNSDVSPEFQHTFAALGDRTCREILREVAEQPLTAGELTERCDTSRSTIYRKLRTLIRGGFLRRSNRIRTDKRDATQFTLRADSLQITFDDDNIGLEFQGQKDGEE